MTEHTDTTATVEAHPRGRAGTDPTGPAPVAGRLPGGTARLPGALALGLRRTDLELRQFFREWDSVVFIFAYPSLMMMIFGTVFTGQVGPEPGVPFAQYFLPGMVATGIMLTSFQTLAISIAVERDEGGLKRLRGTPMPPTAYFLGKVGQVLASSVAQIGLLLVVATVVLDVELPSTASAWATFAWVFVLGTATGAVCGVAFSSVPRSGRSAAAVATPFVLVLQFISGVFFRFDELPAWMQNVAAVFPLKWVAQGMRSVFLPDEARVLEPSGSWQHGLTAVVLLAWLVLALVVGVRSFRWTRRDDG